MHKLSQTSRPRWALFALAVVLMGCAAPPPRAPQAAPQQASPTAAPAAATKAVAPQAPSNPAVLNAVPASRLQRLGKAVNITRWFWFPEATTTDYWESYMTDADFVALRTMGVTAVRLVLDPKFFYQLNDPATPNPNMIGYLDKAIDRLLSHGLAVVVDMHDQDKEAWEMNTQYVDGFEQFWGSIAKRYSTRDPEMLLLELLNEPVFEGNPEKWAKIQERIIATMRANAPAHTIIATGQGWGGIGGLFRLKPLADKNIIYSFHFYDPFAFTHQAATWAGPDVMPLSDIPYPSSPKICKDKGVLTKITDGGALALATSYCNSSWDGKRIRRAISDATAWAFMNKVPIWLGEFGVYCKAAPSADRIQWMKDMADALEKEKVGWSLWGYDECFGMQRKLANGQITLDTAVVQALGLRIP